MRIKNETKGDKYHKMLAQSFYFLKMVLFITISSEKQYFITVMLFKGSPHSSLLKFNLKNDFPSLQDELTISFLSSSLQSKSMPKEIKVQTNVFAKLICIRNNAEDQSSTTQSPQQNKFAQTEKQGQKLELQREVSALQFSYNIQNEWDDDSNQPTNPLQDDLLKQHAYCLQYVSRKVQPNYFKSFSIQLSVDRIATPAELQLELQEYLELQNRTLPISVVYQFDNIMNRSVHLRNYLEWIYDGMPQFLVSDLIYAFRNIVIWHSRNKTLLENQIDPREVVCSGQFLKIIFADSHLEVLKYENYSRELQSKEQSDIQTIPYLIKLFSWSILMILSQNGNNPAFESIEKLEREELKVRQEKRQSKKGKKIKKQRRT